MNKKEWNICIRESVKIALVVGVMLSLINQYQVLWNGFTQTAEIIKVGMNFVVPFSVASYSRYKLIQEQSITSANKGEIT